MSPLLANGGYCVFALTYGDRARPATRSAACGRWSRAREELAAFVDGVLAATGAEQVDLVGHSEGTLMPQYWLQFLGGRRGRRRLRRRHPALRRHARRPAAGRRELVDALGVRDAAGAPVALACGSCPQFVSGSDYLSRMAAAGTRVEGVDYTTVMTRYDELVIPYTSGVLEGATNIVVQDGCAIDFSDHLSIIFSERTGQVILNALDPETRRTALPRAGAPGVGIARTATGVISLDRCAPIS